MRPLTAYFLATAMLLSASGCAAPDAEAEGDSSSSAFFGNDPTTVTLANGTTFSFKRATDYGRPLYVYDATAKGTKDGTRLSLELRCFAWGRVDAAGSSATLSCATEERRRDVTRLVIVDFTGASRRVDVRARVAKKATYGGVPSERDLVTPAADEAMLLGHELPGGHRLTQPDFQYAIDGNLLAGSIDSESNDGFDNPFRTIRGMMKVLETVRSGYVLVRTDGSTQPITSLQFDQRIPDNRYMVVTLNDDRRPWPYVPAVAEEWPKAETAAELARSLSEYYGLQLRAK